MTATSPHASAAEVLASAGSNALGFGLAIGVVVVALLLGAFWWGSRRAARRRGPVGDPAGTRPEAPRDDSWSTPDERREDGGPRG
ncbi:DUF6479 family protein [Streptomyces omiyaensis]|uniref:DUF6479 family protein n=1 Tax=Streptomyces omiyaensis TaxID=68247 RepID=A0ABW7BR76_9ACTN|nr:DUF6479 family protein [Streptomyces omiyaensis]GGY36971.1 hypothetical protein GCM10010363_17040 [Streptomyces omiyaensis]